MAGRTCLGGAPREAADLPTDFAFCPWPAVGGLGYDESTRGHVPGHVLGRSGSLVSPPEFVTFHASANVT